MCEKGERETTPEERATVVRVLEGAKAALPRAPAGWVIGGYEEVSAPSSLCRDFESVPWQYGVSRQYARADNVAEREQALEEQGAALRASMAARQPRMDALMARNQALAAELATAAQARDQARVDALNAELEKLSKEFESLMNEGPSPEAQAAAVAATLRDTAMSIVVSVNPGAPSADGQERVAAPAGASEAFRWTTTEDGSPRAHTLVLVRGERAEASPFAARAISFHAQADPARIDALVGGIDFAAAAKLVR